MDNKWIEIGTTLGGIDFGDGPCVAGIGCQAIDCLGRHRDNIARLQPRSRLCNGECVCGPYLAFPLRI
jgi:hypothetical protein